MNFLLVLRVVLQVLGFCDKKYAVRMGGTCKHLRHYALQYYPKNVMWVYQLRICNLYKDFCTEKKVIVFRNWPEVSNKCFACKEIEYHKIILIRKPRFGCMGYYSNYNRSYAYFCDRIQTMIKDFEPENMVNVELYKFATYFNTLTISPRAYRCTSKIPCMALDCEKLAKNIAVYTINVAEKYCSCEKMHNVTIPNMYKNLKEIREWFLRNQNLEIKLQNNKIIEQEI